MQRRRRTFFVINPRSGMAIFNYDNPWTRRFGEEAPGQAWFTSLERGGSFARGTTEIVPFPFTDTPLAGKHNLENILLATTTARLLGIADTDNCGDGSSLSRYSSSPGKCT